MERDKFQNPAVRKSVPDKLFISRAADFVADQFVNF